MEHEFHFFEFEAEADEPDNTEFSETNDEKVLKVRLDKWLWAARFFKTRALAREAVERGNVFYDGQRSKPSREIEIGATLQIRHGRYEKIVIVQKLSTRRKSIDEALELFNETAESLEAREQVTANINSNSVQNNGYDRQPFQHPEQRERRVVRFLRRSFGRNDNNNTNSNNSHSNEIRHDNRNNGNNRNENRQNQSPPNRNSTPEFEFYD